MLDRHQQSIQPAKAEILAGMFSTWNILAIAIKDSTSRFSRRVFYYDAFLPPYSPAIIAYLQQVIRLDKEFVIAAIGAGTGIFSRLFLTLGYPVKVIELMQQCGLLPIGYFNGTRDSKV